MIDNSNLPKAPLVTVRVPVPQDQLADFYLMLADFFGAADRETRTSLSTNHDKGGGQEATVAGSKTTYKSWTDPEALEAAIFYWKNKLNRRGKALLSHLANHPGQRFTGEELAELLGLEGTRQVAGSLAWPGRYARAMGYELPSEWDYPDDGGPSSYYMTPEVAEVFREAASRADG